MQWFFKHSLIIALLMTSCLHAEEVRTSLYTVIDGTRVDKSTAAGFRIWRAAACDRCHGANQEGSVGPSLIDSLKHLSKQEFIDTVTRGRLDKGMPSFSENTELIQNIDHLYAYLKARSNNDIRRAKVEVIE
jgi:mono/diheme cytochrome c family protein